MENNPIPFAWKEWVGEEESQSYFQELIKFLDAEYHHADTRCFPPQDAIFSAFEEVVPSEIKAVIIGQDPYHGFGQANGLCFSVYDGIAFPPSLVNIFKEVEADLGQPIPISGNLERWAKQGVFLLNTTLSVREGQPGSHQNKGWEIFTDQVIRKISERRENIVFLLWGGVAKNKAKLIHPEKHLILTSGHPSPLSANRGYWFGNRHFSKCNAYLKSKGITEINW